jgi:hypothetical protein
MDAARKAADTLHALQNALPDAVHSAADQALERIVHALLKAEETLYSPANDSRQPGLALKDAVPQLLDALADPRHEPLDAQLDRRGAPAQLAENALADALHHTA